MGSAGFFLHFFEVQDALSQTTNRGRLIVCDYTSRSHPASENPHEKINPLLTEGVFCFQMVGQGSFFSVSHRSTTGCSLRKTLCHNKPLWWLIPGSRRLDRVAAVSNPSSKSHFKHIKTHFRGFIVFKWWVRRGSNPRPWP